VKLVPICCLILILNAAFPIRVQVPHPPAPGDQRPTPEDDARVKMEKDMAKKANQQRQADLKRDTEKLFKLASELKEYVDKTNENVLSLDVLKKAEEIEKLAHSVKEKMKGSCAFVAP
jgi:methionyl-tRNA synthetase